MEFNISQWADAYDVLRYPPSVYAELVVEQRPDSQRLAILGAWKTGCLASSQIDPTKS